MCHRLIPIFFMMPGDGYEQQKKGDTVSAVPPFRFFKGSLFRTEFFIVVYGEKGIYNFALICYNII